MMEHNSGPRGSAGRDPRQGHLNSREVNMSELLMFGQAGWLLADVTLGYGLVGLLILIFDIWMIVDVVTSSMEPAKKLIWIIVILLFPLLGALIYYLVGRGKR